jgi:hypothetical protein
MSIIPNYLALYNLSQIEADILIVSDLTATTGTIYTLFSTTGTITTLNSTTGTITTLNSTTGTITTLNSTTGNITTLNTTTANIATLITDLWRGTSFGSSMVIGVSGDIGTLTSFRNLIMAANKTITMNATGGEIFCNSYKATATGSPAFLFPNSTAQIEIGNSASTAYIVCAQDLYMGGDNNIWSPNFTYANNFSGTAYANDIRMFEDQLGFIYLGNKLGTGAGIVIQDNASFSNNRVLTMSSTGGKILCNLLTGTANSSVIEIGEVGDTGLIRTRKDLYIGSTPFGSNKGIYCNYFDVLQPTDNLIFCALQTTGTISIQPSASGSTGNILIGNFTTPAGDTSSLFIYKNTAYSANKTLTMSSTGGIINVNTIRGVSVGSAISLFSTTTAGISLGSGSSSGITINDTTTFNTGKDLLFSATGRIRVDRIVGSTPLTSDINIGYTDPLYTAIIQLNQNVRVNRISASKLVLTDTNKQLVSSSFTDTDFARLAADNIFTGTTNTFNNTIACNTISATSTTSTGSLFGNILGGIINIGGSLTGTMNIGNTSGGNLTINPSVVLSSNKNLTLQGTGIVFAPEIRCPLYNSTNATTLLEIGKTNTTAGIIVGGALSSGSITLGLIGMSGGINCNANIFIGTSANNKGVACNYFQTFNVGDLMRFAATSTSGSVRIGENQSTGNIVLGHTTPASDSGGLTINKFTTISAGKSLTLSSTSNFISDNIRGTAIGTSTSIYPTTTSGSITIATAQTSGNVTIGNGTAANDSGTLTINKNISVPTGKIMTMNGTIRTNTLEALTSSATLALGGNLTASATLNIGTGISTGSTINLGTGATTSLINIGTALSTGRVRLYNNKIHIGAGSGALSTTGLCTQSDFCVAVGVNTQTNGSGLNAIAIGANAGRLNQAANSIVINASGNDLMGNIAGSLFIRPMGAVGSYSNFVSYNPATYEVYYTPSSATYKNNVKNLERDFDDVLKLQSREYRFNQRGNDLHIGYIAEEAYDINKEFSTTNEDGGEPANIAWFNIVLYQNEIIKRLDKELKELKLRVDNLEI